jgi:predicted RNA-binding protein Jag
MVDSRVRQNPSQAEIEPPVSTPIATSSSIQPAAPARPASDQNLEREIAGFARGLLERMGYPVEVDARYDDGAYEVRIDGGQSDAILIGRRGETLEALQHVLAKMASRGREELVRVRVDVSNYKEKKNGQLADRAREMGRQVRETGRGMVTEPLAAAERRIIHRTLAESTDVVTRALGEGLVKRVWIGPAGVEIPEDEPAGERQEGPRRSERSPVRTSAVVVERNTDPEEAPQEQKEVVSWLDPTAAEGERVPTAESPEWGRRPKPAKGRRAR